MMAMSVIRREVPRRQVRGWEPFRELEELHERALQVLDSALQEDGGMPWVPLADIEETDDAWVIEAELPGVDEKDVSVTFANGVLTIKGEKKHEKEEKKAENYYLAERSFGSFERAIRLPDSVDDAKVEAKFDKGVLKVTAAKKPEAVKAERKIRSKRVRRR